MAEEASSKKRKLELNWDEIDRQTDGSGSIPEVVTEKDSGTADNETPRRHSNPPSSVTESECAEQYSLKDDCVRMSDRKLEESIQRQKKNLATIGRTLHDGGRKIRAAIKFLEDERERRKSDRARMDIDKSKQPAQLANPGTPRGDSLSQFGSAFIKKIEGGGVCSDRNGFDGNLSALGRGQKVQSFDDPSHKARQRNGSSRQLPFQSSCRSSVQNGGSKNTDISPGTFYSRGERIAKKSSNGLFRRIENTQVPSSHTLRPRKGEYVHLSDDDDEVIETVKCEDRKFDECMNNDTIFYPSRDDEDPVEVHYKDITCLAPESLVKSTVMSFYIRYLELQVIPTKKTALNYHIFSTFFYSKLKQELSEKGNEKESLFLKFRKWWKGVNLFEKAYVLIPIHEDYHWSLVIICFPEKVDKSELILLHLDSLELHSSRDIFEVIKSCLREEWKCLHRDVAPADLQMSDNRIFKRLPGICSRSVKVPQQGNDYDCGIFVLYFMERFIEQAPERLKQQDLNSLRCWFNHSDAYGLRRKIRNMLKTEFRNARDGAPAATG